MEGDSGRLNGRQESRGRYMVMVVAVRKLIKKERREGVRGRRNRKERVREKKTKRASDED